MTFSLILGVQSFAQEFSIGAISYGGTGCKAGTAELTATLAGELSLQLSDFRLKSSKTRRLDRKTCSLALPIEIPAGFTAALVAAPEGNMDLDRGTTLNFRQENFLAGSQGSVLSKTFSGPKGRYFSANDFAMPIPMPEYSNSLQDEPTWTACGDQAILRVNLSAMTRSTGSGLATAEVDTIRMKLLLRPCN